MVLVMGIVFLGLIIFSNWQWRNQIIRNVPVYDNLMQVKVSITKGQLLLERLLAGDQSIRIENIWPYYDQSILSVKDIINGRSTITNFPGIPLKDNKILNQLKQLETIQSRIQKLAFSQWKGRESYERKEHLNQRFLFYQLESHIDEISYQILTNLSQMMKNQRKIHSIVLMLWSLILSVVCVSLLILGKRRNTAESALQDSHDKMEQHVKDRTHALKNSNEKLYLEIDERKKAEASLKDNEQRYKIAQRVGQVGNWEFNLVTENFWGSDEAKRIYGFNPESKNFTTGEVEKCIPDREMVHQALMELIENNRPYDLEFKIHPVSGPKQKFIKSIAELQKDDSGKPCKVTGVIQDITRQKEQEGLLLEREKLQGVLEMAGAILHELNQPLQVISGSSEILLMDIKSSDSKYNVLKNIQGSVKRMAILMRKIKGITHYQSKPYLKRKIVDIEQSSNVKREMIFHDRK